MLLGAGGFAANPDSLPVEFCKRTIISGATLLSNDVIPNGATIISVQAPVGGVVALTGGFPDIQWDDDGVAGPASFTYTIQDNTTFATSTATVTVNAFFPTTQCADDGVITFPFTPGNLSVISFNPTVFAKTVLTANDTFGGATSPPPNTANPIVVTILQQTNPPYVTLFDSNVPTNGSEIVFPIPLDVNNLEIECFGGQGGDGGDIQVAPTNVGQVGGFGGHRRISNMSVTPGNNMSIGIGGQGGKGGLLTAIGQPTGGSRGARGTGYSDVDRWCFGCGSAFGTFGNTGGGPAGSIFICEGGIGGVFNSSATPTGAGGGGGGGSTVAFGTFNVGPQPDCPVACCAGGGGGGGGTPLVGPPIQGPGFPGGNALAVGTGNNAPLVPRELCQTFSGISGVNDCQLLGSRGRNGSSTRGGGGGGYMGGNADNDIIRDECGCTVGNQLGAASGGENGDTRTFLSFLTKNRAIGIQHFRTLHSRTTITDLPGLQVGNGRVIIRGRFITDDSPALGQDYPTLCDVVDLGANFQVTTTGYGSFSSRPSTFHYTITDTKTGVVSSPCLVVIRDNLISVFANNKSGTNVTENVPINISRATVTAGDTFPHTIGAGDFEVLQSVCVPPPNQCNLQTSSPVNCTAVVVGNNVLVTPGCRAAGTTCSFKYRIQDAHQPVVDGHVINQAFKCATFTMTVNQVAPNAVNDNLASPNPIEDLGQSPPSVNVLKTAILANDSCGTVACPGACTFLDIIATTRCTAVSVGANVVVTSTDPISSGATCNFTYRVINAQGAVDSAVVTLTLAPVVFSPALDTGFHTGVGNFSVPALATLMKSEVYGASGGDGDAGVGGNGGAGAIRTCISVVSPFQSIEFACGSMGTNGGPATVGVGIQGGSGGPVDISGTIGNSAHGFLIQLCPACSCPLDSDGGTPLTSQGCRGGAGMGGSGTGPVGGGGGGGAGSCVWFGAAATNNIINAAGGGGGGGDQFIGTGGGTTGQACNGFGRNMVVPNSSATPRGHGGGGGGFRGGDETQNAGQIPQGGPGGGSGGNTPNFIAGSSIVTAAPPNVAGRVVLSFA